jgi:ABC-2 type transport system permease protein
MARSIAAEGGQYFGFLVVGMIMISMVNACVNVLPIEVGGAIGTGTLEALLATPTPVGTIIIGLSGFNLVWTGARALVLLAAAWALGATVQWSHAGSTLLIVLLVLVCHLSFGAIDAAFVIAFRTAAGLPRMIVAASIFLGGVYYPTTVIPSWLQDMTSLVPLTYGLRAIRRVLLEGASLASVGPDVGALALFALAFLLAGSLAIRLALAYGRRAGTLAQY